MTPKDLENDKKSYKFNQLKLKKMAIPAAVLAAIIGGVGAIGQGSAAFFGQRSANRTNIKLAKEANERQLALYNMQNEYNNPANQMKRLSAAGLNPYLVYGSGNVAGNVAKKPDVEVPSVMNELRDNNMGALSGMLAQYQDMRVKNAQTDNIKANTSLTEQRKINEGIKASNIRISGETGAFKLKLSKVLAKTQYESAKANLRKLQIQNRGYEYDSKSKKLDYEMQSGLKPYNLTVQDNYILRALIKAWKDRGKINYPKFKN